MIVRRLVWPYQSPTQTEASLAPAVLAVLVAVRVVVEVVVRVVEVSDGWVRVVVDPVATGGTDVVVTSPVAELVTELVSQLATELVVDVVSAGLVVGAVVSDTTDDVADTPAAVEDPVAGTSPELQALSANAAEIATISPPRWLM
ncbi:hypothetical protein [Calidifontibacter indicus]|uniref:hypothetical protein n=1 Tax=Calidifontibacter indicus TaxID=419650 RepID=UPI001473B224|nr:hypothetical protein [Calidifontibacter indicus]